MIFFWDLWRKQNTVFNWWFCWPIHSMLICRYHHLWSMDYYHFNIFYQFKYIQMAKKTSLVVHNKKSSFEVYVYFPFINGNFRTLKRRYVSTRCLAIFSGDIPWNISLKHRPKIYGIGTSVLNRFLASMAIDLTISHMALEIPPFLDDLNIYRSLLTGFCCMAMDEKQKTQLA